MVVISETLLLYLIVEVLVTMRTENKEITRKKAQEVMEATIKIFSIRIEIKIMDLSPMKEEMLL